MTVITVVRNGERVLEPTLKSVIGQTWGHMEYLVIDGASTDGTVDLIRRHEGHISHWSSEPDGGFVDAFNKGIDRGTGDLFSFMNAGDTFHDERAVEDAVTAPQLVGHDLCKTIVYGDELGHDEDHEEIRVADHHALDEYCSLYHQATFIGADIQRRLRYDPRLRIGTDYDFWLRCRNQPDVCFVRVERVISRFSYDGVSCAPENRVHALLEREILKTINRGERYSGRDVMKMARVLAGFRAKKALESVLGTSRYQTLKKYVRS